MEVGLGELNYYRECLESDIENNTEVFYFYSRSLDIKGLYASSTSSLFTTEEDMKSDAILNIFFLHLVPTESATQLIIGYHKEHYNDRIKNYCQRWIDVKNEEIGIMLTALFTQIETWGMSPSTYKRIKEHNLKCIIISLRIVSKI